MTQSTQSLKFVLITPTDSIAEIVSFSLLKHYGKNIEVYRYPDLTSILKSKHSVEIAIVDVDTNSLEVRSLLIQLNKNPTPAMSVKKWLFFVRSDLNLPKLTSSSLAVLRIDQEKLKTALPKFLIGTSLHGG
jgi:hypothetical protein